MVRNRAKNLGWEVWLVKRKRDVALISATMGMRPSRIKGAPNGATATTGCSHLPIGAGYGL